MNSGLIIYVIGKEPPGWKADLETISKNHAVKADRIEIITEKTGHFDVDDAWLSLIRQGMKMITCKIASFSENGDLSMHDRELRLCG